MKAILRDENCFVSRIGTLSSHAGKLRKRFALGEKPLVDTPGGGARIKAAFLINESEPILPKQPKRILVVDDEENARIGLSRLLAKEGFLVDSVANGFEALNYLREQEVNLIVTDINMPEMNGITFLKELNRSYPSSNVIMITAYGGVESYIEAMNLGAFEYINKPVKIDELKSILKKIFKETSH
jgi:CheY-like chemotaxis protein